MNIISRDINLKEKYEKEEKTKRIDPFNHGYCIKALSNGRYKSVWHRAVVNADSARMSVASFLCPCNDAVISTPEALTNDGSRATYRSFTYAEYYKKFWSRNLDQEHCLELFKNQ